MTHKQVTHEEMLNAVKTAKDKFEKGIYQPAEARYCVKNDYFFSYCPVGAILHELGVPNSILEGYAGTSFGALVDFTEEGCRIWEAGLIIPVYWRNHLGVLQNEYDCPPEPFPQASASELLDTLYEDALAQKV